MTKTQPLSGKRILLFSQYFFGYENKIADKMTNLGAIVSLYDEMSVKTSIQRAFLKVSPNVFKHRTEKYYRAIFDVEKEKKYDYVLFIDCEMPTEFVLEECKSLFPSAKFCLHMWDSMDNLRGVNSKLKYFDFISTFDRKDARDYQLSFRPLFFSDEYRLEKQVTEYEYDFSFIGTIHSDRYSILREMMKTSDSYFVYPYLQSKFIYYYYKATKPEFKGTNIKDFAFDKISSRDIAEIVKKSRAVVDIQHPRQTGLTMRTLEMLGMRKKFITTNTDIINYDFYNDNNICIIDRKKPFVPDTFFETDYKEISEEIYEYYSIDQWVIDVLGV